MYPKVSKSGQNTICTEYYKYELYLRKALLNNKLMTKGDKESDYIVNLTSLTSLEP